MKSQEILDHMLNMASGLCVLGNYESAAKQYKSVLDCDVTNTTALYNLGVLYATGKGVEKDLITAGKHFRKCTLYGGDAEKLELKCLFDYMHNLTGGNDYLGIFNSTLKYLREVFDPEKNESDAGEELYDFGVDRLEKKDYSHAYSAFRAAADYAEKCDACYNLGVMYFKGIGVEKNGTQAKHWFSQAAQYGDEGARSILNKYF